MQVIGGVRRDGSGPDLVDVVNPATSAVVEQYAGASAADVEAAVSAAKAAYGPWSKATPGERASALFAWADLLETRAEQLAQRETLQTGKPIRPS